MKFFRFLYLQAKTITAEQITLFLLGVLPFLLPLFFIPSLAAPLQLGNTAAFFILTIIAAVAYGIHLMRGGKIILPRNVALYAFGGVLFITAVSALLSNSFQYALIGDGFAVDTLAFIGVGGLGLLVAALLFHQVQRVFPMFIGICVAAFLLCLGMGLRFIFGADVLSFGAFPDVTANPVGSWNDLGMFLGLAVVVLLTGLSFLKLPKQMLYAAYALLCILLAALSIIHFSIAWACVGIYALALTLYSGFSRFKGVTSAVYGLIPAAIVTLFAATFLIAGSTFNTVITDTLDISHADVRPSFTSTFTVARGTYENNALFGSGPHSFVTQWATHRPASTNNSSFWDVDFAFGAGYIPTLFVTTGLVGGIAWLIFFSLFLWSGFCASIVALFSSNRVTQFALFAAYGGSIYVWAYTFFYTPGPVMFAIAFILTGTAVGLTGMLRKQVATGTIYNSPLIKLSSTICIAALIMVSVIALYGIGMRYSAGFAFGNAAVYAAAGDIQNAEAAISRALTTFDSDVYRRNAARVGIRSMRDIAAQPEANTAAFERTLTQAIGHGQRAAERNPESYRNWWVLGDVYATAAEIGVQDAYARANDAYIKAIAANTKHPGLRLARAQLEFNAGNLEAAQNAISEALARKPNFVNARILLAQVQEQSGSTAAALETLKTIQAAYPESPVLLFEIGRLSYISGAQQDAIQALNQAIALSPNYANAQYALGLAEATAGNTSAALTIFTELAQQYPEVESVARIKENLEVGEPIFTNVPDTAQTIPRAFTNRYAQ